MSPEVQLDQGVDGDPLPLYDAAFEGLRVSRRCFGVSARASLCGSLTRSADVTTLVA